MSQVARGTWHMSTWHAIQTYFVKACGTAPHEHGLGSVQIFRYTPLKYNIINGKVKYDTRKYM